MHRVREPIAAVAGLALRLISLSWLTGPIFDKELRAASRRRRNYVLRFAYLGLLTVFTVLVWLAATDAFSSSGAYTISRMSLAGRTITTSVVWFQFLATQLVAVIVLSTAISDEVYHRTLGTLMTTPISGLQIVLGKLFSRLWQCLILLALSLPVLAVVRVFGGIPWDFVAAALCINLTAIISAGAVSLFFSVRNRRAYVVILRTLFVGGIFYAFLPWITWFALEDAVEERLLASILLHINPLGSLYLMMIGLYFPGGPGGGGIPTLIWPLHCAIMLGISALVLALCVARVRKVALRQAVGEADVFAKPRRTGKPKAAQAASPNARAKIRRVAGSPVIWKELKAPLFSGRRLWRVIGIVAVIAALIITYVICASQNALDDDETHLVYCVVFVLIGTVATAVRSATSITSEKESRSWPILLGTTLGNWHIVLGKAVGILRRCLPAWLLLAGHVVIFALTGMMDSAVLWHLAILVVWVMLFFTGSGLYFSARFNRTTTAVVMNIALGLALWAVVPGLLGLALAATHADEDPVEWYVCGNPMVQTVVAVEGAMSTKRHYYRHRRRGTYSWPDDRLNQEETTGRMLRWGLCYVLAGGLFAAAARRRIRRNIF